MSSTPDPFFKPIGDYVEEADAKQPQLLQPAADAVAAAGQDGADATAAADSQPQKMVEEIESLCMQCGQNGMTRLLLTYIPYFKEVIVVSFMCDHCGHRNNEIQSAGQIQEKGCLYTVHCNDTHDLNRQIVKSEWCTVAIPELQITVPAKRGQLTTIEGVLSDTLRDLELDQPVRKHVQPEVYAKIEALCNSLRAILGEDPSDGGDAAGGEGAPADESAAPLRSHGPVGSLGTGEAKKAGGERSFPPFSIRLDDPSGNSFVEFLGAIEGRGINDVKWTKRDYPRSREQNELLGLYGGNAVAEGGAAAGEAAAAAATTTEAGEGVEAADAAGGGEQKHRVHTLALKETPEDEGVGNEEILMFPSTCSSCNAPLDCLMKKVNIPYFKDIIIMSTNCERCGYRDNEVKSGSAISEKGRKLTLTVQDSEDLSRDILKSDTAGLEIPEIELHLAPGTLGGRFTTLEGLLQQVYDELNERAFTRGDSAREKGRFEGFLGKLKAAMSAEAAPYTVVLDDPLANSYIQNPYAPDVDEQVVVLEYERSWEQNEDLGLNDINVDNYAEDGNEGDAAAATEGTTSSTTPAAATSGVKRSEADPDDAGGGAAAATTTTTTTGRDGPTSGGANPSTGVPPSAVGAEASKRLKTDKGEAAVARGATDSALAEAGDSANDVEMQ